MSENLYLGYVRFNDLVVLLENISVYEFVLFSRLKVHAVLITKFLLQLLKVLVK